MNVMIWNVRRAYSAVFKYQCEAMVKHQKPYGIVLLETHMVKHKRHTEVLKFDSYINSSVDKLSRRIIIMWKKDDLKI